MLGFILKKTFSELLIPLNISLIVGTLGWYLAAKRSQSKIGNKLILIAILTLYGFSTAWVSNHLLVPLESRYPTITTPHPSQATTIVVLGGGISRSNITPYPFKLGNASVQRLTYGITLYQKLRAAGAVPTLILSGGDPYQQGIPEAQLQRQVAISLGIPAQHLVTETQSKDTANEASLLQTKLHSTPFYLVTSADHLPRAMALFQKQGMHPIAAPTDFNNQKVSIWAQLQPSTGNLQNSNSALHEYLGLIWGKWLGLL